MKSFLEVKMSHRALLNQCFSGKSFWYLPFSEKSFNNNFHLGQAATSTKEEYLEKAVLFPKQVLWAEGKTLTTFTRTNVSVILCV